MVEVIVGVAVLVFFLAFAIPGYISLTRHTRATRVMADLFAVRAASFTYFGETGMWPPEYAAGLVPKELAEYLPRAFTFQNKRYQLEWENWRRPDGSARAPRTGILIGVSVVSNDAGLLRDVQKVITNATFRRISKRKSTLEILGMGGF